MQTRARPRVLPSLPHHPRPHEDRDFYPDGRDLGENYTFTMWRMSPCVTKGELDCVDCHTSSGRYRFAEENPNGACLPCHQQHVDAPTEHTHHPKGEVTDQCISCHMPMTHFANMNRSDHSMRAPSPAATLAFESPNACNTCHEEEDTAWAQKHVTEGYPNDYQKPILEIGKLIDAARKSDWTMLPEMLAYMQSKDRDEIVTNSLVRLINGTNSEEIWPVFRKLLEDPSPLIRASAADALTNYYEPQTVQALLKCTQDSVRLVRIRAASALAALPKEAVPEEEQPHLAKAMTEWEESLANRLDDTYTHYNLGNMHMSRGNPEKATKAFETAIKI